MALASHICFTRNLALSTLIAFALTIGLFTAPASADLGAAANSVPAASLVGKGRMTVFGFKVFDAELYAPGGSYSPSKPFALKLTYLRKFKGVAIAEQSVKEIRKQGRASESQIERWTQDMKAIFPNVSPGQSITGVRTAQGGTLFYLDNRKIGSINDPAFSKSFFSIWLGNRTRNSQLRAQLVGAGS
ncbi:MAG: chalcone isomerase family protein [Roseibium sp.]